MTGTLITLIGSMIVFLIVGISKSGRSLFD